jgi:acetyltransferase/esterase
LLELYHQEGAEAALKTFAASIGVPHGGQASNLGLPQERARIAEHNRAAFFRYDAGAVGGYTLDIAALQASPARIALAGGLAGRAYFPYRCAAALAERLETAVVEFPGAHAGFVDHPPVFAERLREVVGDQAAT